MAKLIIKEYLTANNISNNELARRLGVRRNAVRRYLPNPKDPKKRLADIRFSSLEKIAFALECGVKDLIDDEKYEKRTTKRKRSKEKTTKGGLKMKRKK